MSKPFIPEPGDRSVPESLTASSPQTYGIRLNHTMLRISEPERSLSFYQTLLGMSLIFTLNTGPFVVFYLGYPSSVEDTTPKDIASTLGSRTGLLELVHTQPQPDPEVLKPKNKEPLERERATVGFGHLGFTVPDVGAVLERAREAGWRVLKWPEETSVQALDFPPYVLGEALHERFVAVWSQIGMVEDPDGYSIEVVPSSPRR